MTISAKHPGDEQLLVPPDEVRRHALGQFLTPDSVADFMASLFGSPWPDWNVLDAGAGQGALSAALVRRLCARRLKPESISITAIELDETMLEPLRATLAECRERCARAGIRFAAALVREDFFEYAALRLRGDLFAAPLPRFNAAIVNPPYCKIRSDSTVRLLLRSAGIETTNLYTGFVALIARLLADRGELVAITPRSFCNGPYFKSFRIDLLQTVAIQRLHVFASRSAAFRRDRVLQENIILHAVKGASKPRRVVISSSSGAAGAFVSERAVGYPEVVAPGDPEQFIHLPEDGAHDGARAALARLSASLSDLDLSVSTGRVVDFRARAFLRQEAGPGTVPLIYPCHFNGGFVHWPKARSRKPNAIVRNEQTRDLLMPCGIYVLVKRFTAKEERKRLVACLYDPGRIDSPLVGFENHLNYFHRDGGGLSMDLAKGLAAYLNSTVLDTCVRQFNGHTQVNATDLRNLKYPSLEELERLGRSIDDPGLPQPALDALVNAQLF